MVLSDRTIRRLLAEGRIGIDPYDEALLQPSSVDVRVDRFFRVFHNARYPFIDVKEPQEDLTELVEIDDDEPFILHPGEFVLGSTLERITLPDDLVARLEGKSSLGRLGLLIHSTAGFIDPGWDGHVTLELSNVANLPITIYYAMKIGQLSFVQLTEPAERVVRRGLARLEVPGPEGPDAEPLLAELQLGPGRCKPRLEGFDEVLRVLVRRFDRQPFAYRALGELDLGQKVFDLDSSADRLVMPFDVALRGGSENGVAHPQRRLRGHRPLGRGRKAIPHEENSVWFDRDQARVGAVVAADVTNANCHATEIDLDAVVEDDVGGSDLDGPRRRQLILHVRSVVRRGKPSGYVPVETFVAPVSFRHLDQPLGRQRMRDHDPTHLGAAEDVIPSRSACRRPHSGSCRLRPRARPRTPVHAPRTSRRPA